MFRQLLDALNVFALILLSMAMLIGFWQAGSVIERVKEVRIDVTKECWK